MGVALGRTCAVLAPGADPAVLAIVVPRGMRPRRTAGAAEQRGAEQRQRRHVTARMRSTTVRVVLLARIFGTQLLSSRREKCVAFGMHHRPLFRKLGKKSTTKGNAHRREYKFCCTSTIESILHSTVLSDTTSADALSVLSGQSPATASL